MNNNEHLGYLNSRLSERFGLVPPCLDNQGWTVMSEHPYATGFILGSKQVRNLHVPWRCLNIACILGRLWSSWSCASLVAWHKKHIQCYGKWVCHGYGYLKQSQGTACITGMFITLVFVTLAFHCKSNKQQLNMVYDWYCTVAVGYHLSVEHDLKVVCNVGMLQMHSSCFVLCQPVPRFSHLYIFFVKQRTLLIAKASIKGGHNTTTKRNKQQDKTRLGRQKWTKVFEGGKESIIRFHTHTSIHIRVSSNA